MPSRVLVLLRALPLPCWAVSVVLYWAPSKVVRPTLVFGVTAEERPRAYHWQRRVLLRLLAIA